ncbi:MAG: hypothetical protein RL703_684, partial [Pseudomonadota bacterium]
RGGVSDFDGDLDDYQQYLLEEAKRQREAASPAKTPAKIATTASATKAKPNTNRLKGLQRDLEKLDQQIARLQQNRADQEAALAGTTDAASITETGNKLHRIQQELDALEARWLTLAEDIEACQAA